MVLQIIDMRLVFGNELLQSLVLVFVSVELGSCQLALYIHPSGYTGNGKLRYRRFLGGIAASYTYKTLYVPCYTYL
jgi:hypothetical protein